MSPAERPGRWTCPLAEDGSSGKRFGGRLPQGAAHRIKCLTPVKLVIRLTVLSRTTRLPDGTGGYSGDHGRDGTAAPHDATCRRAQGVPGQGASRGLAGTQRAGPQGEGSRRGGRPGRALIELLNIRISRINGCVYCLDLHLGDAVKNGESGPVAPALSRPGLRRVYGHRRSLHHEVDDESRDQAQIRGGGRRDVRRQLPGPDPDLVPMRLQVGDGHPE